MSVRIIVLANQVIRARAQAAVGNLPADGTYEVVLRPRTKARTPGQNRFMWGPTITQIAEQAFVDGQKYSPMVWHEHFKREYLPEGDEPDFERRVKDGYQKWETLPSGDVVCIGSTTKLTTFGMSEYVTAIEAYAAQELGVIFRAQI